MTLSNGISVTADGNTVTFSKIVGSKLLELTKTVETVEKCLFWAKMYGTMTDLEWKNTILS